MTERPETTLPRDEFGPLVWGWRGRGIDIEPSCRLWGLRFGKLFLGVMHKDKPGASSSPVSKYRVEPANGR
jgi:hypothetical protein